MFCPLVDEWGSKRSRVLPFPHNAAGQKSWHRQARLVASHRKQLRRLDLTAQLTHTTRRLKHRQHAFPSHRHQAVHRDLPPQGRFLCVNPYGA